MEVRPIDANALYDALRDNEFQTFCPLDEVDDVIAAAPTLDYAPVKHGEFEFQEFEYIPGLCVAPVHCKTCDTTYFTINKDGKRTACCPYCGALMGEKNERE